MSIKIMMACPTLNRIDMLEQMLHTVAQSTRIPDRVLIVNNGRQFTRQHHDDWSRYFNIDVYTPQYNLGVAGSVNLAWSLCPRDWFWMHCNDDTEIDSRCIELMAEEAEKHPDGFIIPESGIGLAFTLFIIRAGMREKIGMFDEQFYPAYCEDNCLGRRMNMYGIERRVVKGAFYVHHTSSTLAAYTPEQERKHHDQFRENVRRYTEKWGGPPDKETFSLPYDGKRGHTAANMHLWHEEYVHINER